LQGKVLQTDALRENPAMPPLIVQASGAPRRLDQLVLRHALTRPAQPALTQAGQTLDYAGLAVRVDQACAQLQAWGVRQGDRVACLSFNAWEMLVLLLALARLGGILAPLNHRLAQAEWDQLMQDCQPQRVLHDVSWREQACALAQRHGVTAHSYDELWGAHGPSGGAMGQSAFGRVAEPVLDRSSEDDERPLLLVYTSGTTGRPRAAVHTQAHLMANMVAASQVMRLTAEDRVLTMLPLFHVGGLCIQTLPALGVGAHVTLQARFDPQAVLHSIGHERIGLTVVVPAVMKALVDHPLWAHTDLTSLRCVMAGSSTLPEPLVQAFLARGLPLGNVYGATETGPFSIALTNDPERMLQGVCGWPCPGVQARLGPLEGASPDTGEVWLRGPALVRHYWPALPALDAQGWFHSGDVARVNADGSWTIVGRCKDMIISGGENIYPAEIEGLLGQHPAVAECAVLGVPDARWGERVVAVVVMHEQQAVSDDALLALVRERLARYKHPREVVRVQALPKTALGKVQKAVLKTQLSAP
jgi:fatty-acyl-CoA synthase